jgi:cation transport regulator ChaB
MPYTYDNPPKVAKGRLPVHCKHILVSAFNAAKKHYGDESRAWATAWAAVKKKCRRKDGETWTQFRPPREGGPEKEATRAILRGEPVTEVLQRFSSALPPHECGCADDPDVSRAGHGST